MRLRSLRIAAKGFPKLSKEPQSPFSSWNEAVGFERHFWPDCVFKDCYGEHKKCK